MWPQGNNSTATASDVLMMAVFNATERNIDQFQALVEPVGLKIAQVFKSPTSPQSILELELVQMPSRLEYDTTPHTARDCMTAAFDSTGRVLDDPQTLTIANAVT